MRSKKFVIFFLSLSIPILAILPLVNLSLGVKEATAKALYTADKIEGYINLTAYQKFERSLIEKKVIVGKDGFLFLGNSHGQVANKTKGVYKYDPKELEKWAKSIKKLQSDYEAIGAKFLLVIAPNKHSVYKEKLPDTLINSGSTITDEIVRLLSTEGGVHLLDLRGVLVDSKSDEKLLYWKTDSHWNEKGASIAFDQAINKLNTIYSLNLKAPKYELKSHQRNSGDLATILKIDSFLPKTAEIAYRFIFDKEYEICLGNIEKEGAALESCKVTKTHTLGVSTQPTYTTNQDATNNLKLLYIHDSFGTAPSQLYQAGFSTLWRWHYGFVDTRKLIAFSKENKADIVIYQIVERALFDTFVP